MIYRRAEKDEWEENLAWFPGFWFGQLSPSGKLPERDRTSKFGEGKLNLGQTERGA